MEAKDFLARLKILPKIIENCELQVQVYKLKALNTTSGGITVQITNRNGKEETHIVEKVKSSSCGDPLGVAVANYVDIERKIEALKIEKKEAEDILEQLEPNQYEVLYKYYILDWRIYEIADKMNKSDSLINKTKKIGLKNLQKLLNSMEHCNILQDFAR